MFLAKLAVDRPVLATVIIFTLVIIGGFSYTQLSQDLTPKVEFPFIIITTIYPGAGPKEVESQVTEILEDEVGSVGGLRKMESNSMENLSLIMMEFELEVDADLAKFEVKDKVDLAKIDLPDEIEPPVVEQYSSDATPILNIAINSERPLKEITTLAENRIKDQIAKINGVGKVDIIGGLEREINIACHIDKLRSFGLSIADVVGFIQAENLNIPSGTIVGDTNEYSLRVQGEFKSLEQIENVRIISSSGAVITLKDIAEIQDSNEKPAEQARFQGKPAVSIAVRKKDDANTVIVANRVKSEIEKLGPWLEQEGLQATIANDRSKYITDSIDDALSNILIGIILTSILLYLFLHDLRSTLVVAIAMPASIIATFSLMYFAGFTINIISLMALGISIGVLVVNSIVVLENISNKINQGLPSREAAIQGTGEIAIAVVASTATNIMVFTPIAFMKGIIGRFFLQFGLTVVFATIISLLISFTLTPMLAKLLMGRPKKRLTKGGPSILDRFAKAWDDFYDELAADYKLAIHVVLRRRLVTVLVCVLSLVGGCGLLTQVGSEFFPQGDEGIINIGVKLPPGTSLEQTDRTERQIAAAIADIPEIKTVLQEIGGTGKGVNEGTITVNLVDIENRKRSQDEVITDMRPMLAAIPAAEINISTGESGGPPSGIQMEILGPDLKVMNKLAEQAMELAAQINGVVDIRTSYQTGKPEFIFIPDRNQLANYGVTSGQVGMVLRTAFEGQEVSYYREGGEDYDIRVQLVKAQREEIGSFENMLIRTPSGYVPLTQLGQVKFSDSEVKIERKDKRRMIKVLASASGITEGEAVASMDAKVKANMTFPSGYEYNFGGRAEMQKREFGYIFQALILAIVLTYLVLCAILEDFVHPFTIMTTLPLGMVGVGLALFLANVSINMMSLMAIVMLVGIVVNNAILILDYTKQLRQQGMETVNALVEASSTRLRPIIMTNLAIAISVIPQAMSGAGAEFRRALAVVTMGGVLVSAIFTLFLIPAIYTLFDHIAIKPKVTGGDQYDQ